MVTYLNLSVSTKIYDKDYLLNIILFVNTYIAEMLHAIATGYRLKCKNTSHSSLCTLGPGYIMSLREISLYLADATNTILVLVVTLNHHKVR